MNRPTPPQCNPDELAWRKASASSENGACVEVARALKGWVAVRDSKDPGLGPTMVTGPAWASFIATVATGEL
ncbi:DUF397 domain-containing protein [Streptomyces sp. NBC_01176]|uniref:DUF397 domain-containing protein n=1 Tax=Streptomyces sp. NBC_01176 TaxID=2903760 RepID=UPI002F913477|nr:DUF397 domain-containing protein [Streptomyces sp. NBC_01176]